MTEIPEDLLLQARALINQAVAEAAAQGRSSIRALYFVIYPADDVLPEVIYAAVDKNEAAFFEVT